MKLPREGAVSVELSTNFSKQSWSFALEDMKLWSLCSIALFPHSFRWKGLFLWSSLPSSQKVLELCTWKHGLFASSKSSHTLGLCWTWFQEKIDHQKHRPNSIKNVSKQVVSCSWRPVTLYAFFHSDQSEGPHTFGRSVRELPHFLPFNVRAPILLDI